ncbi:MAG: SUMF1/EgtB/PvdO family nonheme iron enzyme [Leptolyngbyaceae bacterium]|nr:SUMF1/EgtB/PvdO family nonheme iron enzyme [Leptolyngbyaceae bacterium]
MLPLLSGVISTWVLGSAVVAAASVPLTALTLGTSASTSTVRSQPPPLRDRPLQLWQDHQVSVILAGVLIVSYMGVLWINPLWLLKLPLTDITLPWTSWKIPLGMVRSLKYRNRVLDVWVNQHWEKAKDEFLELPNVKDRRIHIALPVDLNQQLEENLSGDKLSETFSKKSAVLLITGEGGAGKTSLACQIALWGIEEKLCPHRLLPVLIETELDDQKTLFEAIRGQLNILTDQSDPISSELLEKLLYRQRVLVIVDHLSEMSEATRKKITPELAEFPAKALVITSRINESLGGVSKTLLEPRQFNANSLIPFISVYLKKKYPNDRFADYEYDEIRNRLQRMAGERNITVLLARLFIDFCVKEWGQGSGELIPDSVPKLMLRYLKQLNQITGKRDDLEVWKDATVVAWECLRQTYRPQSITKEVAIAVLTQKYGAKDIASDRLRYLEESIHFLQPRDQLYTRIILDPLAEYLAAYYLVQQKCQDENPETAWEDFFSTIDQKVNENPEIIQGFLLAVRDWCKDDANDPRIPDDLPDRLARKANIPLEELRHAQEVRRIRQLAFQLSDPDLEFRLDAAEKLGRRGEIAARIAEPNLIGMLENRSQTPVARQAAAQALGKLCIGSESLLRILTNPEEDLAVRRMVAESLGVMKAGKPELLDILENEAQPILLRMGAARALSLIGAPSGEPVPMLIVELKERQATAQVKQIPAWKEELAPDLTLDLVAIPAGEFLMGSPSDEEGRDVYSRAFPETEGLDVEMQHRVSVQGFGMSQFPITQAQWRAIATQPAINRNLNPDPAQFKGDNRPVECVSWYDAVEFCARLSKLTGKDYRLPSEAEWEYACRAGTITPFHFGETLNTAIANYKGTYTYGSGETGDYRNATTDVGSFGVVNSFGLSDMHGNVWEWCLDHWHPSYENAPDDGRAWMTGGDDRYRLLRGGSWYNHPAYCRSAFRYRNVPGLLNPYNGFRVVYGSS